MFHTVTYLVVVVLKKLELIAEIYWLMSRSVDLEVRYEFVSQFSSLHLVRSGGAEKYLDDH